MASDQTVMMGLGIVFFGLAWISFKLNESESDVHKYLGVVFLALSMAMLQVVGWVAVQISLEDAALNVILGDALVQPVLWIVNIVMFLFWLVLLLRAFVYLSITIIKVLGEKFGGEVRE